MDVGGKQEQLSSPFSGHSTHGRSGKRVCAGQGTPIWRNMCCIHTYMTHHVLYSHLYDASCAVFTLVWRIMCCIHTYMTHHVLYSHLYDASCAVFTPIWRIMCCIHTYMTHHVLYSHLHDASCAVFTPIWRIMCCIHTYMTHHALYSHLYDASCAVFTPSRWGAVTPWAPSTSSQVGWCTWRWIECLSLSLFPSYF